MPVVVQQQLWIYSELHWDSTLIKIEPTWITLVFLRILKWVSKLNHNVSENEVEGIGGGCSASGMMQQKHCSASDLWLARTYGWLRQCLHREGQGDDICQLSILCCTEGTRGWWRYKDDGDTVSSLWPFSRHLTPPCFASSSSSSQSSQRTEGCLMYYAAVDSEPPSHTDRWICLQYRCASESSGTTAHKFIFSSFFFFRDSSVNLSVCDFVP